MSTDMTVLACVTDAASSAAHTTSDDSLGSASLEAHTSTRTSMTMAHTTPAAATLPHVSIGITGPLTDAQMGAHHLPSAGVTAARSLLLPMLRSADSATSSTSTTINHTTNGDHIMLSACASTSSPSPTGRLSGGVSACSLCACSIDSSSAALLSSSSSSSISTKCRACSNSRSQAESQAHRSRDGRDNINKHIISSNPHPIDSDSTRDVSASSSYSATSTSFSKNILSYPSPADLCVPGRHLVGIQSSDSRFSSSSSSSSSHAASTDPVTHPPTQPITPHPTMSLAVAHSVMVSGGVMVGPSASSSSSAVGKSTSSDKLSFTQKLKDMYNTTAATRPTSSEMHIHAASVDGASSSSSASIAASTSTVTPLLDTSCHCLVVDDTLLEADSDHRRHYTTALTLTSDNTALSAHVASWLMGVDASELCAVYTTGAIARASRLHINFTTMHGLAAALSLFPFLVRCGTITSTAWGAPTTCGPTSSKLPELIQLSCIPARPHSSIEQLNTEISATLANMNLTYYKMWPAKSSQSYIGTQPSRINVYVLPRHISTLAADIDRLHMKFELLGSKLRVHAPNTASLTRCTQCDQLGHSEQVCPKYSGLAIRLLFRDPLPCSAMRTLTRAAGAKVGYLGSSVDELQPSRRLTLLFDSSIRDEAAVLDRLRPVIDQCKGLLHEPPTVIEPRHRNRECKECGSMTRPHSCPFQTGFRPALARPSVGPSVTAPRAVDHHITAAAATSHSASPPAINEICNEWRARKVCGRAAKGNVCQYAHPSDHVILPKAHRVRICYDMQNKGSCSRPNCTFDHSQLSATKMTVTATHENRSVVLVAPAPAAAAAVVASSASAPVTAADATPVQTPLSTPKRIVSVKRKNINGAPSIAIPTSPDLLDDDVTPPASVVTPPPASSAKKSRGPLATTTAFGITKSKTAWADVLDGEDDEEVKSPSKPFRSASSSSSSAIFHSSVPVSSLSFISSPAKLIPPSRSNPLGKGRDRPGKPKAAAASSAVAATAAAAAGATASNTSSASRSSSLHRSRSSTSAASSSSSSASAASEQHKQNE